MIIQNYKTFFVDSRGLRPLASAMQEKPSSPPPWWGKQAKPKAQWRDLHNTSWLNLTQIPAISPSEQLCRPSNKITAAKRATYIIYNYHTGGLWPLLQPQAAVPATEITPQQPSYFEPKSACTWHVVSIYPPKDQMKRIGEKNSISMI